MTLDTLRPLPQFMGISANLWLSPGAFSAPSTHIMDRSTIEKVKNRVNLNVAFFLTNYVLLAIGVGLVVALSHPRMLIAIGFVFSLWSVNTFLVEKKVELIFKGKDVLEIISPFHRWCFLMAVSIAVGISYCLLPLVSWFVISGFMILVHATLRDPKHIESSDSFRVKGGSDEAEESEQHLITKSKLMEGSTVTRRHDVV